MIESDERAAIVKSLAAAIKEHTALSMESFRAELEELADRIGNLKQPEKGERGDPGPAGLQGERGEAGIQGAQGEPGPKGEKGDRGEKGESLPGPQGERGERGEKGEAGAQGPAGGTGPQGSAGMPGRDALQIDILPSIDLSRSYPRGTFARYDGGVIRSFRDTLPGDDLHRCGWEVVWQGLSHLSIKQADDQRTFSFVWRMTGGETIVSESFNLPVVIYRGVFKSGTSYQRGDMVTCGGSGWHCQVDFPIHSPGENGDWILAIKEGRKGHDGKEGPQGPPGKDGRDGRDLTQMSFDGRKY